ncbi:TetR/AcrR family transcriptional regulator [Williamsia sp. SKLECPSW1]
MFTPDSSPSPRGGRPRDETVDGKVLPVVRDLLLEVGWNDLSVRAVAARSGVARATINRRWETKAGLVLHAVLNDRIRLDDIGTDQPGGWIEDLIAQSREIFSHPEVRTALPGLLSTFEQDPDLRAQLWTGLAGPAAARYATGGAPERRDQAEVDALAMIIIAAGTALFTSVLAPDITTEPIRERIDELLHVAAREVTSAMDSTTEGTPTH